MSLQARVRGGTRAGWKRQHPKPPPYWSHECWAEGYDGEARLERGYLVRCPDCGARRGL